MPKVLFLEDIKPYWQKLGRLFVFFGKNVANFIGKIYTIMINN
ncbi:hypothetical protein RINTHM_15730 [Richelia intracellularis HM01]|nr:hypothetical protein [Richelia intracellularis]CCH66030.1 hypothetical protein RINTHM_15730 [Richelia intracellularis HM01]